MNKRKPFTPNTQSQGSSLESPAQVEAEVANAGAEIAELAAEIAALKKEVAEIKEEIEKKSKSDVSEVDPRVDKIWEAIVAMGKGKLLK